MFEKCFGKDHYETAKVQMEPLLLNCRHASAGDYIKDLHITKADLVWVRHLFVNDIVLTNGFLPYGNSDES